MRSVVGWLLLVTLLTAPVPAQTTWYVDVANCPGPGTGTALDPFCKIQDALDAAADFDEVVVADGVYLGPGSLSLRFNDKKITLRSENGPAACILDAAGGRCISFMDQEGPDTIVDGFTLTNAGQSAIWCRSDPVIRNCVITGNSSPGDGAGIFAIYTKMTIESCVITNNVAGGSGGGIYIGTANAMPTIVGCLISGNSAEFGGGVCTSGAQVGPSLPSFTDCVISGNQATSGGGGFAVGGGTILFANRCRISGNTAGEGGGVYSGGIYGDFRLSDCWITDNTATSEGGAAYLAGWAAGIFRHCTMAGNVAPVAGGVSAFNGTPLLDHTIVYGNTAETLLVNGSGVITAQWSDIEGGLFGLGNFDADPLFMDPVNGDYRLDIGSPCADAGNQFFLPDPGETDLDGEPRVQNGRVDVGGDEGGVDCNGNGVLDYTDIVTGTSSDCGNNTIPDECEPDCNGNGFADSCDLFTGFSGDGNFNGIPDDCEALPDCNGNNTWDVYDISSGFSDDFNLNGIPDECDPSVIWYVDDDSPGDPGPGDPTVSDPLEDGSAMRPFDSIQEALDISKSFDEILVADGVYAGPGNGVIDFGGREVLLRSVSGAANCVVDGEGVRRCFVFTSGEKAAAIIDGFTLVNGYDPVFGGAIYCDASSPTIRNCLLRNNAAGVSGGAIYCENSSPTIRNSVLRDNAADFEGGAIYLVGGSPTVERCLLTGNTAGGLIGMGGAISVVQGAATIVHCTITGNAAVGSFASSGGGVRLQASPDTIVRNSIIWGNTAATDPDLLDVGATVTFSDIGNGHAGAGNIDADPQFVDAAAGAYCLLSASPCVDAGDPDSPLDPDGTVADMGALPYDTFCDVGNGLTGTAGVPQLDGNGMLTAGSPTTLSLSNAHANSSATLVLGAFALSAPFKGGTLVPSVTFLIGGLPVDAAGDLVLVGPWPPGIPSSVTTWMQYWIPDAGAPQGFAASNAIAGTTP